MMDSLAFTPGNTAREGLTDWLSLPWHPSLLRPGETAIFIYGRLKTCLFIDASILTSFSSILVRISGKTSILSSDKLVHRVVGCARGSMKHISRNTLVISSKMCVLVPVDSET